MKIIKTGAVNFDGPDESGETVKYEVVELDKDDPSGCRYAMNYDEDGEMVPGPAFDEIPDDDEVKQLVACADFG